MCRTLATAWSALVMVMCASGCGDGDAAEAPANAPPPAAAHTEVAQPETDGVGQEMGGEDGTTASEEPMNAAAPEARPASGTGGELSESDARDVARRAATAAGYDLSQYRITSTTSSGDVYTVSFEAGPPTPPGGHFGVLVHARAGTAEVMPGE